MRSPGPRAEGLWSWAATFQKTAAGLLKSVFHYGRRCSCFCPFAPRGLSQHEAWQGGAGGPRTVGCISSGIPGAVPSNTPSPNSGSAFLPWAQWDLPHLRPSSPSRLMPELRGGGVHAHQLTLGRLPTSPTDCRDLAAEPRVPSLNTQTAINPRPISAAHTPRFKGV